MHTTEEQRSTKAPASPLDELATVEEYQGGRVRVFPSKESVRWYIRQHRKGLEGCGALLHIHGRLWAHPPKFDAFVIEAGQQAAQRRGVAA